MFTSKDLISIDSQYGAHNYKPLPIVINKAYGVWVEDMEGKKYMDMLSAYSALNFGHSNPEVVKTLQEQVTQVALTSRAFYSEKMVIFLKKLADFCQMEKVLPMNTGAEAVETALKAARKWGYKKKGVPADQAEIIVCENNFHGRTITIISFTSEAQYKDGFGPLTPGFKIITYGDIDALEKAITPNTVAFLAEPIQGEGGILIPPQGYLQKAKELCKKNNVLFILDEIQTGLGRTGKNFAYEYEDAKPDMIILGKALGGGVFPVSAVVASAEILDVFNPGDHGSTFGGNPLGAAVGIKALELLKRDELAKQSFEKGQYFMGKLREMKTDKVLEIRGKGLLIGLEIKKECGEARPYCEKLMADGVLCKETHHQVIRFAPPLVITKEEMDWALERIEKVLL